MKKLYIALLVLVIAGAGYYVYDTKIKTDKAPQQEENKTAQQEQDNLIASSSSTTSTQPAAASTTPTQTAPPTKVSGGLEATFSSGNEIDAAPGSDVLVTQINYDGKAYSPSTVDIKVGDVVIFKNNSSTSFWPASAPHPTHTAYPEFDAKKAIPAGGTFQFTFTKAGSWKFHDHLNPSAYGTINVTAR